MRKNIFFYDISSFTPEKMKKLIKAAKNDDIDSIDLGEFESENNDKRFITGYMSEEQAETHIQALDEYDEKSEKAAKLPYPYNILFYFSWITVIGLSILQIATFNSVKSGWQSTLSYVVWLLSFAFWYGMVRFEKKRKASKEAFPRCLSANVTCRERYLQEAAMWR